ncbi:MAG: exonuclease domain-containing protein [Lachnospiraceae bacterium]|nr:exonuclease domain-containing protein [Lachnospiraceae bacterium]
MNYIVLDLEWNQSAADTAAVIPDLPFEIIEIGAIKINDRNAMISEFSELVRPQVYHELNRITSRLIHMQIQEFERGKPFCEVAERFLEWCGDEEYRFCTWGPSDLTELQRNMQYYGMPPLSKSPLAFLDVQKIYTLTYEEDKKTRHTLEYAVDALRIDKDIPFHRAFSDAYYTSKVLIKMLEEAPEKFSYLSYDLFHPPLTRDDEIKVQFETYAKYISRVFRSKTEALADREVISSKCYLCHCNLRKKIKWFTSNGRHYYCLAYCDKHGYLKGKLRIHRTEGEKVYVVKTTRLISEEEAESISVKRIHARELRKRRKKYKEEGSV